MKIASKFKPLFKLFNGNSPEIDTVIITGGRYSAKSYTVGLAISESMVQKDFNTLYTRFTNQSIKDSVSKEITSSIELLGYENHCEILNDRVNSKHGNGNIVFKGIKTGSGNQTANLKSLSGFNVFVVDEAEEIPNFQTFKKVYYSIRSADRQNISVLILNPSLKSHWIYNEFFTKKKIQGGFNGIVGNVLYIHVSYLDLDQSRIPKNILEDFERLKVEDPETYNHVVLGGWLERLEGSLFNKLNEYDTIRLEDVESKIIYIDPAFEGLDYTVAVLGCIIGSKVYIEDVICTQHGTDYTIPTLTDFIKKHNPNTIYCENNGGGALFFNMLQKELYDFVLIPVYNTANKQTRIISAKSFVHNFVYFKSQYDFDSEYYVFLQQIKSYNKDNKLNHHDDSPDALAGLIKIIHGNFSHLF